MLKSEQIRRQIECLNSELENKEQLLARRRASAVKHSEAASVAIRDFVAKQQSLIEQQKAEGNRQAKSAFQKKHNALLAVIQSQTGLTYAPWDSGLWDAFEIHRERPDHKLTRLGAFRLKTRQSAVQAPATFQILGGKNLVLRASGSGRQKARQMLRNAAFRLLASLPPGKLRFTFIDPVDLGSTAAGLVGSLPDFLTGGIAWHEEQDIQDQLSLIETRIATIKTKYLGVNFASIEQFNSAAGTIEEPYWLIVVSDCPVRFREVSLQKLLSVAKNGPQAGIYLALMLDESHKKYTDSLLSELIEPAHHVVFQDDGKVFFDHSDFRDVQLELDGPPNAALAGRITEQVNKTAATSQSVKVDWQPPAADDWWKEDSRHGIEIPLGLYGARKTQFFRIDEKLLNSALVIGKPGSGKSRLLHVLINGLTTRYSPEEIALYLLDCKQVEFRDYATYKLPHARVVATESEREFGLSVLRRLSVELDARKNEFSSAGETSLSSYRTKTGKLMPRIVLIVDEFQELLSNDDALAREAAGILDRLVRQGRAFGINIILASQTLSGQTTLNSSTKNQIPIRVVLQCSESDSISVLSQENDEARLLERPGEAIYNAANGRREGNNRFQVSWLSDEALESVLIETSARAAIKFGAIKPPVVFDGNSFADIRQNALLNDALKATLQSKQTRALAWLGEPIEMKDSTSVTFKRQSRSNLLLVGQNEYEQTCVSMMLTCFLSLTVQHPPESARFIIFNLSDPEAAWNQLPDLCQKLFPHEIQVTPKLQFSTKLNELVALIEQRSTDASSNLSAIFVFIIGLHRDRSFRKTNTGISFTKQETKPASNADLLAKICREGAPLGIHTIIWSDTFSSFERVFQTRSPNDLDEFSLRIALQMSESDSRSLIDSDAANRLGSHRAILFDDEKHGRLEKFRPYHLLNAEWIESIARQLIR